MRRRLAQADATNAGWQRGLFYTLAKMASLHPGPVDFDEALSMAGEGLAIAERLVGTNPANRTWQVDLEHIRSVVARLRGMGMR